MKVRIYAQCQEQEILPLLLHPDLQIKGSLKRKKKKVIGKRSDLAALYSLMGKEGWQERKNPEFC